jgi:hypothetical protein
LKNIRKKDGEEKKRKKSDYAIVHIKEEFNKSKIIASRKPNQQLIYHNSFALNQMHL